MQPSIPQAMMPNPQPPQATGGGALLPQNALIGGAPASTVFAHHLASLVKGQSSQAIPVQTTSMPDAEITPPLQDAAVEGLEAVVGQAQVNHEVSIQAALQEALKAAGSNEKSGSQLKADTAQASLSPLNPATKSAMNFQKIDLMLSPQEAPENPGLVEGKLRLGTGQNHSGLNGALPPTLTMNSATNETAGQASQVIKSIMPEANGQLLNQNLAGWENARHLAAYQHQVVDVQGQKGKGTALPEPELASLLPAQGKPSAHIGDDYVKLRTETESRPHPLPVNASHIIQSASAPPDITGQTTGLNGYQPNLSTMAAGTPSTPTATLQQPPVVSYAKVINNGQGYMVDNEALAMTITRLKQNGQDSLRIKLDPQELGRIDVKLDLASDGLNRLVLSVDRPETFDLLNRDSRELQRSLEQAGVKLNDQGVRITLNDQGQGRHEGHSDHDFQGQDESHQPGHDSSDDSQIIDDHDEALSLALPYPEKQSHYVVWQQPGLDIRL